MAVPALRAFRSMTSGSRRPRRRADMHRRPGRCGQTPPPALDARRSPAGDGGPHPLGPIRVGRHGPRGLYQLRCGEPVSPENHATSRVAHQTVQRAVVGQTLQVDHRVHESRVVYGRGRQLAPVAPQPRDQQGGEHDGERARNHLLQRYLGGRERGRGKRSPALAWGSASLSGALPSSLA